MAEPRRIEVAPLDDEAVQEADGLSLIRQALKAKLELNEYEHVVPLCPSFKLVFSLQMRAEQLGRWTKACADKTQPNGTNTAEVARRVIANQNTAIKVRNDAGEWVRADGSDAQPLTLRHRDILDMFGATTSLEAVRELFGDVDGHMIECSNEIAKRAGFDPEGSVPGEIPPPERR